MITSPIKRDKPTVGERVRMGMVPSHKPDSLNPVAQGSVYGDQRFADMRDGKRGVTQPAPFEKNLNQDRATPEMEPLLATNPATGAGTYDKAKSVVKEPKAYSTGQSPMLERTLPDGNGELSIGGSTLRTNLSESDLNIKRNVDALNAKVASMNPADITPEQRAQIQEIREQARPMWGGSPPRQDAARSGQQNAPQTIGERVRGLQQGQQLRYKDSRMNIDIPAGYSPSGATELINSFRGMERQYKADQKSSSEKEARLAAMNGGMGPGPSAPSMPNLSGLGPDEIKAQVDAYQAQQATYDNFHQNATNRMNNESDNVNKAEQNKYMKDYYGGSVKNDTEKTRAMINSSKLEDMTTERVNSIRDQLMANPDNKDLQRKFEILTGKQSTRDYKADQRNKMISEIMGQTGVTGGQISYPDAAGMYDIDQANLSGDPDEIIKAYKKHMAPGEVEAYDKMDDITKSLFIQMDPEQKKLFLSTAK